MKLRYLPVLWGLCYISWAHAEIYKRVDAQGHVTYSSVPLKGAKKLHLEPLPTMPPPRHKNVEAADFPRVDSETQKERDNTRKQILEDELVAEQKALAEARVNLLEGAGTDAGKNATQNAARQDQVLMHEKNIEALKTEIANSNK